MPPVTLSYESTSTKGLTLSCELRRRPSIAALIFSGVDSFEGVAMTRRAA
jgi:hypothetical protein